MSGRWLPWRRFTPDQMIMGGLVAVAITQVVLLGLTGQGSPPNWIPERWTRRRDK